VYVRPSVLTGTSCWCSESHAPDETGTSAQLDPPHTLTGLSLWMGLPASSGSCMNCTYWPLASVYVAGLPFPVPATPVPGAMSAVGLIVTCV
jgi:hypothetical protein